MGKQAGSALWLRDNDVAWIPTSIGGQLVSQATERGDAPALYWPGGPDPLRTVTYGQLYDDASRLARALLTTLEPGAAVGLCAPNSVEWVQAEYACALAGLVLVPMNPAMADPELAHILKLSGTELLLTVERYRGQPLGDRMRKLAASSRSTPPVLDLASWAGSAHGTSTLPTVAADDVFLVQYTSGTTGRPKGAVHTHASTLNAAAIWCADWGHRESDVLITPVPLHHVGASVNGLLGSLAAGAAVGVMGAYDPAVLVSLVRDTRATVLTAVPTMLFDVLRQPGFNPASLPHLHTVVGGGSAVPAETVRQIETTFGVQFVVSYGQSESPSILQTRRDDPIDVKANTIGRPLPGRDARIARPDGSTADDGEIGEICTRSPMRMSGYLGQPDATAEVIDAEDWLHTGDLGAMDERGYVTSHGRAREVIIRGGENLYPGEIEAVLARHPSVRAIAVVGGPDERWGEVPVAFVVPTPNAAVDGDELEAHGREHLASFKVPRRWIEVSELPLTASGKVRKVALRESLSTRQDSRS
jgi:fatty-acyl-CoA synthase